MIYAYALDRHCELDLLYNSLKMSREKKLFKALFVSGDRQYHLCLGIANINPNKREGGKNTRNDGKNIKLRITSQLF